MKITRREDREEKKKNKLYLTKNCIQLQKVFGKLLNWYAFDVGKVKKT